LSGLVSGRPNDAARRFDETPRYLVGRFGVVSVTALALGGALAFGLVTPLTLAPPLVLAAALAGGGTPSL